MINKPGTFLLFAAVLCFLASGCKNASQSWRGKEPPLVTKTLAMKIPEKVSFVIWSVLRADHCSVQVGSPGKTPDRTQLWLLKSDGTAIPQAQDPVRLNVAMGKVNTALSIYDFTASGCAKAVSVVLSVDGQFLVEPLTAEGK